MNAERLEHNMMSIELSMDGKVDALPGVLSG